MVRAVLKFSAHVFQRPGEVRQAEWVELDLENALWRISAERMKLRREHLVPLSRQVVEVLRELQPLTSGFGRRYVFPSNRTAARPMSENTICAALRYLGYEKDKMSAHGFRSSASTLLNELGFSPDVIEAQLAHAQTNRIRAAYNRAAGSVRQCQTGTSGKDGNCGSYAK